MAPQAESKESDGVYVSSNTQQRVMDGETALDYSDNPFGGGASDGRPGAANGFSMGRGASSVNTAAMGAGAEMWSGRDRLRKFEIDQRNAAIGEPALIPGTGDFADFSTALTKNGYSITHDVWDTGLSKIAVYKADGSSSSVFEDLGIRSPQKERSFVSSFFDPVIAPGGRVMALANNTLMYLGAKYNGDAELAAVAANALASRTTAEAGLLIAGGFAGARLSGSSKAAPALETNSAEAFAARPTPLKPAAVPNDIQPLAPGWAVQTPRGVGAATGELPSGYKMVSRWVKADEIPLWNANGGTAIPSEVGAGGRVYVTEFGATKPGGTGPVRIDFAVPEAALSRASKPEWFQIFQPVQSTPVYNVRYHIPEGLVIPKGITR